MRPSSLCRSIANADRCDTGIGHHNFIINQRRLFRAVRAKAYEEQIVMLALYSNGQVHNGYPK